MLDNFKMLESFEATSANIKLLEDKQIELGNLRKHKINGYITRSRMQWLQEGEKPSSFFCNLEKRNCVEKTIKKLQLPSGTVLNTQKEILQEVRFFFIKIYLKAVKPPKAFIYLRKY